MNLRKKIILILVMSIISCIIGFMLTNSVEFSFCSHDQYSCRELLNHIGDPLFYGMLALSAVFLILLFFPGAFTAWKKFAIWFVPLATIVFIFYKGPSSGDYFSPYPEQVFKWISVLYVVVSSAIILKSFKSK